MIFSKISPTSLVVCVFMALMLKAPGIQAQTAGPQITYDGVTYNTVQIGEQLWMRENLRTTKYADGTTIPHVTSNTTWGGLSTGAWANYGNNSANDAIYGKLYNWYAVDDSRGLCPTGWKVPSWEDWIVLEDYLGGPVSAYAAMVATSGWINGGGNNSSGFTALPGGLREHYGGFNKDGNDGYFWSSTNEWSVYSYYVALVDVDKILYARNYQGLGFFAHARRGKSVRCLQEPPPAAVEISTAGYHMMSAPRSGEILTEFLDPIWTQGMTGGDVSSGRSNVWTFDDNAPGKWVEVTNLNTVSLTAGQGFLVYVFEDTDYTAGNGTLPVDLSVSSAGVANSADVSINGIGNDVWHLAGNPYDVTLDWDAFSKTGLSGSVYVYDPEISNYRSWNGTTGTLAGGLVAPYQAFFIQGSGGSGSLTMSRSHTEAQAKTVYDGTGGGDAGDGDSVQGSTGSLALLLSVLAASEGGSESAGKSTGEVLRDEAFLSFNAEGKPGVDLYDALKLMPLSLDERALLLLEGGEGELDQSGNSVASGPTWSIANLPWSEEGLAENPDGSAAPELVLPLQALNLGVDADGRNVPVAAEATLTWDAAALPSHVSVTLRDRRTGVLTALEGQGEIKITTPEGPAIERVAGDGTPSYRSSGDAAFELVVSYEKTAVSTQGGSGGAGYGGPGTPGAEFPTSLTLEANYPNPFNPATQIRFGLSEASANVSLTVHDLLGRRVATLIEAGTLQAGWHELTFEATNLPSGTYIYRLKTTTGPVLIRQMTLLK